MPRVNPFAFFDCLAVSTELRCLLDAVAPAEVHLFTYLACLLSVYRGRPAAAWGYSFAGTRNGSPYSPELESSKAMLLQGGYVSLTEAGYLKLTSHGCQEYETLAGFSVNSQRIEFLAGACASVLTLPVGWIKAAITSDSQMRLAAQLKTTRPLLTQAAVDEFYDDFQLLAGALGADVPDLMIPAVVWLRSMKESADVASGGAQCSTR